MTIKTAFNPPTVFIYFCYFSSCLLCKDFVVLSMSQTFNVKLWKSIIKKNTWNLGDSMWEQCENIVLLCRRWGHQYLLGQCQHLCDSSVANPGENDKWFLQLWAIGYVGLVWRRVPRERGMDSVSWWNRGTQACLGLWWLERDAKALKPVPPFL